MILLLHLYFYPARFGFFLGFIKFKRYVCYIGSYIMFQRFILFSFRNRSLYSLSFLSFQFRNFQLLFLSYFYILLKAFIIIWCWRLIFRWVYQRVRVFTTGYIIIVCLINRYNLLILWRLFFIFKNVFT